MTRDRIGRLRQFARLEAISVRLGKRKTAWRAMGRVSLDCSQREGLREAPIRLDEKVCALGNEEGRPPGATFS